MSEAKVTLTDRVDVYNFTRGKPLVMDESGRLHHETWRDRLRRRLRRVLWWRQSMNVVTAVDVEAGTVTMEPLRWSWWRWKWVRR